MCGILGFVSKNGLDKASQLIVNGYYAQQERGQQSFGAVIGGEKKVVIKSTRTIVDFVDKINKNKFLAANLSNTLIFHHRMASKGSISKQNTHPFVAGNICLVHNGTWNDSDLFRGDFEDLQGETDSEIIAHLINQHGTKGIKEINGSASLVWLNKKDGTLNFWRNRTPMVLAYIRSKEILLFASTIKAISAMIGVLEGIKKVQGVFLPVYVTETTEHIHYKVVINPEFKIEQKIIKPDPPKTQVYNGSSWGEYGRNVYPENQDLFSNDIDWDYGNDFSNKKVKGARR